MTFYADMADTASGLLTEFGQTVTLTESVPGSYDPATGATGSASVTTQTGKAVMIDYSSRSIDGTLIMAGDKMLKLSPLDTSGAQLTPPKPESTVTMADGTVWTVKRVEAKNPAGVAVLYTLQVRQ